MLFALEAQLGREFRTTFAKARGELGDIDAITEAVESGKFSALPLDTGSGRGVERSCCGWYLRCA
jgi:hypothetical protein